MPGWSTTLRADLTCTNCNYHGPMLADRRTIACPACGNRQRQRRLKPHPLHPLDHTQQLRMHQTLEALVAHQFPHARPTRRPGRHPIN